MARKNTFLKKEALAKALTDLPNTSRFLALQLIAKGFVSVEKVHTGKRGKPAHVYTLTGKGRGYVALSKNWYKPKSERIGTDAASVTSVFENIAARMVESEHLEAA